MTEKTLTDQIGTSHTFESTPKRIVSLVPSLTELLFDLGLEEQIVGITKFCVHPFHFKSTKKIIGGTKNVHVEKIRLLQPDIIIANKEENTLEIVAQLAEICPVWVTNIITLEDNYQMITDFGQLFNKRTEAQKWNDKIQFVQRDFQQFIQDQPSYKVAYFIWANPYMVAGGDTFVNEMLRLNKFQNIYENNYVNSNSSVEGVAENLASFYLLYGDVNLINTEIEIYRSITREEIRNIAKKYLNPNQRLILDYVPGKDKAQN